MVSQKKADRFSSYQLLYHESQALCMPPGKIFFLPGISRTPRWHTQDSEVITVESNRNPGQGKNQCPENKKAPENKKRPEGKKEYGPENKNPTSKGY